MTILIAVCFAVAALIGLVEAYFSRASRPYLPLAVALGFIGALIWRLQ